MHRGTITPGQSCSHNIIMAVCRAPGIVGLGLPCVSLPPFTKVFAHRRRRCAFGDNSKTDTIPNITGAPAARVSIPSQY